MKIYRYRLLNVFAESTFGGNPLCVFEDAQGMDDATMQALALQFNLSETTFVLPATDGADARVRIFTPGYEMRFAGHPTLGTAHVVRALQGKGDQVRLSFPAGIVGVRAQGDTWTLTAPTEGAPRTAAAKHDPATIASHLGLAESDLLDAPRWVDTGADQLLVPVKTAEAVLRAQPDGARLDEWELSSLGRRTAYVFAFEGDAQADGRRPVTARYFFAKSGGGVAEDPGTGSACANLGGWLLSRGESLPASLRVSQGDQVSRPCRLLLDLSAEGAIQVGGRVIELGQGEVRLP